MITITAKDVSELCDAASNSGLRVLELERVLNGIATMWPEPESCGDLSVNGINDGKQRLITAHYAVNAARKALGMPLHKFPGEGA